MADAFIIEKYVSELLRSFNEKHNTRFSCMIGQGNTANITSKLDKQSQGIFISIPLGSLDSTKTETDVEALKIMLGHELSHHIYANMSLSAVNVIKMSVDSLTGKYRRLLMSCCIESAADIRGKKLYLDMSNKTSISKEIYEAYYKLIELPFGNLEKRQIEALKVGYLPANHRIQVMKTVDSFKEDNYQAVEDIAVFIDKTFRVYSTTRTNVEEYIPWAKAIFELDNFPNRPNRIRR